MTESRASNSGGRASPRDVELIRGLAAAERGLAVVATSRPDGSIQASLVNAGLFEHPLSGQTVVAFVARGGTVKLRNLRRDRRATLVFRARSQWVAIEGRTELIGPDDHLERFEPSALPQLLRDVFTAAGGTHDDWPTYDRVMAEERRTAVLLQLDRVYSNPG